MATASKYVLEPIRAGAEFTLYRARQHGNPSPLLVVAPGAGQPLPQSLRRLEHEYSLAGELDPAWAAKPLALTQREGRTILVVSDLGGEPLDRVLERAREQPLVAMGGSLVEVQREAESSLTFAGKSKFGFAADLIIPQLGLIRMLRGLTPNFGSFVYAEFEEEEFERDLNSRPAVVQFWYWARRLQARFYAGDFTSAIEASLKARPLLVASPNFEWAECEFYSALARAALWDSATVDQRREHCDALEARYKQLQTWAEHCPENFENRAALVGAEIARFQAARLRPSGITNKPSVRPARTSIMRRSPMRSPRAFTRLAASIRSPRPISGMRGTATVAAP